MTDKILARIERNRNKLAELRDAKVNGKELYDGLTFVIGDLFHVKDNIRTSDRLAKIAVLQEVIRVYDFDIGGKAMNAICKILDELKESN